MDRTTVGTLAASIGAQAALVVSGPVTARLLGVSGRGEVALLAIVMQFGSQVAGAGLPTALAYTVADGHGSARSVLSVLRTSWIRLCFGSVALSSGGIVLLQVVGHSLSSLWAESLLVAIWVLCSMNLGLALACLQGERRFRPFNWLRVSQPSVSAVVLLILLPVAGHVSVVAVLSVLVGSSLAACLAGAALVIRKASSNAPPVPQTSARKLLRFGLSSVLAANTPLETLSPDQAAVGLLLSRGQLGLYAVGGALNNFSGFLVSGLGSTALPNIAADSDLIQRRRRMKRVFMAAIALSAAAAVVAELVVGIVLPLAFGAPFKAAVPVARLLIVAGFFLSLRRILVVFLQAVGRPGPTAFGEVAGLLILALLAVVLVPPLGLMGAGAALLLAAVASDLYLIAALRLG